MTAFRHFWRAICLAPGFAHAITAVTLVAWIVKATSLDFMPAPTFVLIGLGHVVDGVLSAIIAGYVFFILFAVYPEYRQRRVIARFLYGRVGAITGNCKGVIDKIEAASQCGIPFWTAKGQGCGARFCGNPDCHTAPGDHRPKRSSVDLA